MAEDALFQIREKRFEPTYANDDYSRKLLGLRLQNLLSSPTLPKELAKEILEDPRFQYLLEILSKKD